MQGADEPASSGGCGTVPGVTSCALPPPLCPVNTEGLLLREPGVPRAGVALPLHPWALKPAQPPSTARQRACQAPAIRRGGDERSASRHTLPAAAPAASTRPRPIPFGATLPALRLVVSALGLYTWGIEGGLCAFAPLATFFPTLASLDHRAHQLRYRYQGVVPPRHLTPDAHKIGTNRALDLSTVAKQASAGGCGWTGRRTRNQKCRLVAVPSQITALLLGRSTCGVQPQIRAPPALSARWKHAAGAENQRRQRSPGHGSSAAGSERLWGDVHVEKRRVVPKGLGGLGGAGARAAFLPSRAEGGSRRSAAPAAASRTARATSGSPVRRVHARARLMHSERVEPSGVGCDGDTLGTRCA
eukprot:scaffold11724_cov124-Isochrysis_galbana.AAC.8